MLDSIYLKTLRDQRHGLLGWSIGVALLVLVESLIWPSFKDMPDIEELFDQYPSYMKELFDIESMTSGMGFLNAELFTLLLPALFLVFAISRGARLIAGEEELGTLDVLLVTPLSGARVLLEKALGLVTSVVLLGVALLATTVACSLSIGMGISVGEALAGCVAMVLLGAEFGLLALAIGAATGRRAVAMAVPGALAVAAYVLYVAGALLEEVDPWQELSPVHQAIKEGPLGGGFPPSFLLLVLGCVVITVAALPVLERRDIAAPG
jgi:ABC-2 type transport system permease protein